MSESTRELYHFWDSLLDYLFWCFADIFWREFTDIILSFRISEMMLSLWIAFPLLVVSFLTSFDYVFNVLLS